MSFSLVITMQYYYYSSFIRQATNYDNNLQEIFNVNETDLFPISLKKF